MARNYEKKTTAQIKAALTAQFPGVKFSVHKGRGTGSRWITVSWTDGPTDAAVSQFCNQFNDSANDDITTDLWCGSQYTTTSRKFSAGGHAWRVYQDIDLSENPNPSLDELVRAATKRIDCSWRVIAEEGRASIEVNTRSQYEKDSIVEAFRAVGFNVATEENVISIVQVA